MKPTAVKLSVWICVLGCGHPISMSVWRSAIIFLAVINSAAISASAADATTFLIIFAIFNTGPLSLGPGSFSESNICQPALLLAFDLLINPASACAANIISLFLKRIPLLGYDATAVYQIAVTLIGSHNLLVTDGIWALD